MNVYSKKHYVFITLLHNFVAAGFGKQVIFTPFFIISVAFTKYFYVNANTFSYFFKEQHLEHGQ